LLQLTLYCVLLYQIYIIIVVVVADTKHIG